jgi:hypothetical protein
MPQTRPQNDNGSARIDIGAAMPCRTTIAAAAAAALATVVATAPAPASPVAEDVVYESHLVRSDDPDGPDEQLRLDVPVGWERNQLNRHSVGFFDYTVPTRWITVDLKPRTNTVREMRGERRTLRTLGPAGYREHAFRIFDAGGRVRVRWVYSNRDPQTEDTWSYTSVFLMKGDLLVVGGRLSDRRRLVPIRRHVVRSVQIEGASGP